MRTGHLFAGAGGGLLADRILGHTPVFAVEWDKYACEVLRQRASDGWFPGLRVHEGDISLWNPSEYAGRVDAIHAGFPCQDISYSGNGEGIDGDKSGLWSEVARVAGVLRPRELFLENSPAIFNRGLDRVLSDLAALGYDAKWLCLSADRVGAPHERDRWWCLANARSRRRSTSEEREIQQSGRTEIECSSNAANPDRQPLRKLPGRSKRTGRAEESPEPAYHGQEKFMAETTDAGSQGSPDNRESFGAAEEIAAAAGAGWWSTEPDVGRMVHGVADGPNRIKALGNGQVPLQAAMAYQLLKGGL